jgi:hypothetical protein
MMAGEDIRKGMRFFESRNASITPEHSAIDEEWTKVQAESHGSRGVEQFSAAAGTIPICLN